MVKGNEEDGSKGTWEREEEGNGEKCKRTENFCASEQTTPLGTERCWKYKQ